MVVVTATRVASENMASVQYAELLDGACVVTSARLLANAQNRPLCDTLAGLASAGER